MIESESYIQSYLNSKSNTLSFYVSRLLNSNLSKSEEQFSIQEILKLINSVETTIQKIGVTNIPVNDFCNQLMLLESMQILKINEFLQKYNYKNNLNQRINYIKELVKNDVTPKGQDKKTIEFLITNHLINIEDQPLIFEFYIKYILLKEQPISYDVFEVLLVDYTKALMRSFVANPVVLIKSADELKNKYGYSYQNEMYLCKEELEQMYNMGLFRPLKTIFHELCHVAQYSEIAIKHETSKRISTIIKDEILSSYLANYYDENYERLLSEAEAELYSIQAILTMFENFGIVFKNNQNPYKNVVDKLRQSMDSTMRKVGDEMIPLEEIFDYFIIHHPELFEVYPQLALEYRIEFGDMVVKNNDFGRDS